MRQIREAEWFGEAAADRPGQPAHHLVALAVSRVRLRLRRHAGGRGRRPRRRCSASQHDVVAVLTRPDAPAGRGRARRRVAGRRAGARGRHRGAAAAVAARSRRPRPARRRIAPDVRARSSPTAASSRRPRSTIPTHGWVNLHFSLLPAWRGAAPVQHAIWRGDDVTGASTFALEEGLDTGPVYGTVTEADPARRHVGRACSTRLARARRRACCSPPSTRIESGHAHAVPQVGGAVASRPSSPSTTPASGGTCPRGGSRPAGARLHPCARRPGRRVAASALASRRSRSGRRRARLEPGRLRVRQARRAGRHGDRARAARARSSRPASARCPRPTGRAALRLTDEDVLA